MMVFCLLLSLLSLTTTTTTTTTTSGKRIIFVDADASSGRSSSSPTTTTSKVAFSSQRLSGGDYADGDASKKKKNAKKSESSSTSSSPSSSRIREATFLATFDNFQRDFQQWKEAARLAYENEEEFYEEDPGKKSASSSLSPFTCEFCGPHSLGSFGGCEWTLELSGLRAGEWEAPMEVEVRCETTVGNEEDFTPSAYQYLARIKKGSKKPAQNSKPRTHRVNNGKIAFEELNASPYDFELSPKKYFGVGGKLEIQVDIKAWKEVKDAPDAVPIRAVIHDAPKKAWSLRAVRRFMKPEDWKRDEGNGAHSNAGEKSAVAWILPTDSKETASYLFREALNVKETQQSGVHPRASRISETAPSFSFQKLGPLGTISERKTRRSRNARLREDRAALDGNKGKNADTGDNDDDDDLWLDDDFEDMAPGKKSTFFEDMDIEDLYQSSSHGAKKANTNNHHMTSVVATNLAEPRGNETAIVHHKISIDVDEELPECTDAPVTGDLGPMFLSFAPDSLRAAHRVTVHGCRADQGGIALVAYSSTADRTHDLWLRVVLLHQEDSELDVVVAGEATVPPLEESWSAPMIMRILPWETSKDSGFVKVSKKGSFGSGSKVTRKLKLTIQARQLRPRRVALRLPLDQYGDADTRKAAKAAAERFGTTSNSLIEIPQAERPCAIAWVEVNPWDNAAKLLGAAAGLASSSSGKIVRPTDIALAVDGVLLPHDWHPDATMLYAAALLGVSASLSISPEERRNLNATAAWRWGLGDGDACTVLPNLKRNVEDPAEDAKCEKIYAKLRDLAGNSDSSKEREKLENSKERLRCDVSQVRSYLTKATENGSKLTIGGLSNLPSTDDLVLALVDAREKGGLESAYNFHKDRNSKKDSTSNKNNRQSSSQGYHRNPFFANGGGFAQTLDEQAETAFILNQFVNANFLPSSSETAAELALIVGTTAYVLLVLYLCAGAFRVYNKASSNRAGPNVAHKKNGPGSGHHHHHGVSPQLRVCLRTMAMSPFTAGWMMAKEPAKFLFDSLKPTISFALGTLLLFAEEIVRSIKVFVRDSKAYAKVFGGGTNENNKNGNASGNNKKKHSEKNNINNNNAEVQHANGESSKKVNGKKKQAGNNNNNGNNNGKSPSALLRDESSKNNSPTASSVDPDTPRVKTEWEVEEEERRQREEEEEMRRHAALRMSEKRLLDAAIEKERELARLEREEKEEKARLAKEAKKAEKAAQKALKSKSASNSPLTSPRTATGDAPPGFERLSPRAQANATQQPRPGFTIPPPVPPGLPPSLSPTKKRDSMNNNASKPLPPPLPKSPPPLNQPKKRNGGGAMLITPAMLRQGVDEPPPPPARRFQFGNDISTRPIGSSNNTNKITAPAPPMPPGAQDQDDLVMSMLEGLSDDDEIDDGADPLRSPTNQSIGGGLFGKWSGFF